MNIFTKLLQTISISCLVIVLATTTALAQHRLRNYNPQMPAAERDAAIGAIDALIEQTKADGNIEADKVDAAIETIAAAVEAIPPADLLAKLDALTSHREDARIPSRQTPVRREVDRIDTVILVEQLRALRTVAPEDVPAYPSAESFPGPVPADAKRVTRNFTLVTDREGWHNEGIYGNPRSPYWHSTGLYAAPGEAIAVTVPESLIDQGVTVRIGCHSDRLWHLKAWRRPPDICTRVPVTATKTSVANAFGGLIYIETPLELSLPKAELTIEGAVEAPHYIHGKTDVAKWRETVRNHPAPWAELQTEKLILTVPSTAIRDLEDPISLMDFWDEIMDHYADLLGQPTERRRTERFVADLQISAGYMHSGYPLMTGLDIVSTMVDKDHIKANGHHGVWGLFHEIGHNHQRRDWTFGGTTEVTVNLFSLYIMEKVCDLPIGGHGGVSATSRSRNMKRHFEEGVPFDRWKLSPFLALAMYIQLIEEFGWEPFTKVFNEYSQLPAEQRPRSDDQKRDQWMVRMSRVTGKNLGPFFQAWGVPTSESARESITTLPDWMPEDMPAASE